MSNFLDLGPTARKDSAGQQQQISQAKNGQQQQSLPSVEALRSHQNQPQPLHPFNGAPTHQGSSQPQQQLPVPQNPPKSNNYDHPPSFQTSDHSQQQQPLNGIQSHASSNPQHQQQLNHRQYPSTPRNQTSHKSHPKQPPNEVPSETHPTKNHHQTNHQQPPIGVPSQDHPPNDQHPYRYNKSSNQSQQQLLPSALPALAYPDPSYLPPSYLSQIPIAPPYPPPPPTPPQPKSNCCQCRCSIL